MMTREEAKKEMRVQMLEDLAPAQRDTPKTMLGGLTPNQAMAEVDTASEAGELFLTEFIIYQAAGGEVDETTRNHVASLMENNLQLQAPGFGNSLCIVDPDTGEMHTPNQMIVEVRNGTSIGNLYASEWMEFYSRYVNRLGRLVNKSDGNVSNDQLN